MNAALRLVFLGAMVAVAYYAAAAVGLELKLPQATPSVLWPPNSVLTSALLLTRVAVWPVVLLSALPTHIFIEAGEGWPLPLVLALFATNCSEALLAASALRWVSEEPTRFDSLRRVGYFLVVVVFAAPFVSSFLDAAAVTVLRGEAYGQVFTTRLFANTLTALVVVPAIVMTVTSGRRWLSTAPFSHHVEAAIVVTSMVLISIFILREPGTNPITAQLAERAPLAWLLPPLLWAAIRLGPGGLSVLLLASTLVLVTAAINSHGPFHGLSPTDTTMAIQLLLIVIAVPLVVVAALIEERRLAQQDISNRLALEARLARLSGAFVQLPSTEMREVFEESLRDIGDSLRLPCAILLECTEPGHELKSVAAWKSTCSAGPCECDRLTRRVFRRPIDRILTSSPVIIDDVGTTDTEREMRAAALIPLAVDDRVHGVLACGSTTPLSRNSPVMEELRLVARILANALSRKHTEDALRASEAVKSAILASLTNGVVVVDRDGQIVIVNDVWRQMVGEHAPPTATEPGRSYLEYFHAAARAGELWASEAKTGLLAVLRGTREDFRLEYVRPHPAGDRTVVLRVAPLDRPDGGAVLTFIDLTDQRRAEFQAQQARAELAHVSRVATMGALTASIAHQLNQPLTGILANAQAAQRFLTASTPDLQEVRTSLQDIMEDDRRASEVIVRMRELLRKDEGLPSEIDVNALVRDVVRLLTSDAIIRNVALVVQLDDAPAVVRGDRVQLEQVVLNLIVNALEALDERRARDRRVIVRSGRSGRLFVEVAVIDNGPGFNGTQDHAFEAFYTTKPAGMGLGLSIARSVVEAHAGAIRAGNNREGGATVSFRLPLVRQDFA